MQVRINDVKLDDKPKVLTEDPTNESHAITYEDNTGTLINITLELKGVTSYFPTRNPTKYEFETCLRVELTYITPEWDPHSTTFQEQEEALMNFEECYMNGATKRGVVRDIYLCLIQCGHQL